MDETLIHSEFESQNINNYRQKEQRKTAKRKPDFEFNMILESGRRTERVSLVTCASYTCRRRDG